MKKILPGFIISLFFLCCYSTNGDPDESVEIPVPEITGVKDGGIYYHVVYPSWQVPAGYTCQASLEKYNSSPETIVSGTAIENNSEDADKPMKLTVTYSKDDQTKTKAISFTVDTRNPDLIFYKDFEDGIDDWLVYHATWEENKGFESDKSMRMDEKPTSYTKIYYHAEVIPTSLGLYICFNHCKRSLTFLSSNEENWIFHFLHFTIRGGKLYYDGVACGNEDEWIHIEIKANNEKTYYDLYIDGVLIAENVNPVPSGNGYTDFLIRSHCSMGEKGHLWIDDVQINGEKRPLPPYEDELPPSINDIQPSFDAFLRSPVPVSITASDGHKGSLYAIILSIYRHLEGNNYSRILYEPWQYDCEDRINLVTESIDNLDEYLLGPGNQLPSGTYKIHGYASDCAGNDIVSVPRTFVIDNEPPEVTIFDMAENGEGRVLISGQTTDERYRLFSIDKTMVRISVVYHEGDEAEVFKTVAANGTSSGSDYVNWSVESDIPACYQVIAEVWATDYAGNQSEIKTGSINLPAVK